MAKTGRKPKFKQGGEMETVTFTRRLPVKGKAQIMKAVDETINQFKEYDWT